MRIAPNLLPEELAQLSACQDISLGENDFHFGLAQLLERLKSYGFRVFESDIPMPERRKRVEPLTREELSSLPEDPSANWLVSSSFEHTSGGAVVARESLYREFRFRTFPDATGFMHSVSAEIEAGQHHPRWENVWTTVRVWLNTWDIEFKPSQYDLELARLLERKYLEFEGRA